MVKVVEDQAVMSVSPLLSVGVLAYHQESYIADCIDGILMQKRDFDMEIVIGVDGVTDRTTSICMAYQERYPDLIRLIISEDNRGLMKNYLAVAASLRGEYMAQVAGDDYWTDPYKLEKQLDFLRRNPEYGMVYTDFDLYYPATGLTEHQVFERQVMPKCANFEDLLLYKRFLAPLTWLVRKELNPIYFDYSGKGYVDESFAHVLDMYQQTKIHYMPEVTAVKRHIVGSLSNPETSAKAYAYYKGLFVMQKEYTEKYALSDAFRDKLLHVGYSELLPRALELDDHAFVAEARAFLKG